MKDKNIICILLIFAVLVMLIFLTPFLENKASCHIWTLFFIIIGVLAIIWIITSTGKDQKGIIERFKNQHIILQILDVMFIMTFVYGIISMNVVSMTGILLCLLVLIPVCQKYLKKENS
ncbi:hypothetical protein [Methanobrevibacter sp.]|uniref:hypothetical protein n=1 Tax=Methanobrevibacter sp. TaxID=66852 RepID=UPI0038690186